MAQANIKAVITAEDKASQTLNKFGDNASSVGDKLGKTLKAGALAAGAAIGVSLVKNFDDAIKRADTLANSTKVFESMGFEAKATGEAMKALEKSILGLPTPLNVAVKNVQLLAGATNDIGLSQKIFTALNNAVIGFGGTTEDVSNSVIQLSEAFSDGRVDSNAWLSLIQNGLGPALNAMARSMGLTMGQLKEGLSTGKISVQQFQDALIKMNVEGGGGLKSFESLAKEATGGIGTAWANMNTAIARGIASLIEGIGRANIANAITGIGKAFETSLNAIVMFGQKAIEIGTIVGEFASKVWTFLYPSLKALWNTIATELLPSLQRLWEVSSPILIPALKILAIIIGGVLLAAIWGAINVINVMNNTFSFLINIISTVIGWVRSFANIVIEVFSMARRVVAPAFNGVENSLVAPFRRAAELISDVASTIIKIVRGVVGAIDSAIDKIGDLKEKATHRSLIDRFPRFQAGTGFAPGGMAVVGEQGPELVSLPRGSRVIPNNSVKNHMGGGNISFNVNIGMYAGTEIEKRKVAKELLRAAQDMASARGTNIATMFG